MTNEEGTVNLFSKDTDVARLISESTPVDRGENRDFLPNFSKQDPLIAKPIANVPNQMAPITEHVS